MGDVDQAISVLQGVVKLSPEEGHEKYMYLGQLLEGDEAIAMTRRGIELLQKVLDKAVASAAEGGQIEDKHKEDDAEEENEDRNMDGVERDEDSERDAREGEGDEEDPQEGGVEELREGLCGALCSLAEMVMGQAESLDPGSDTCAEVEALLERAASTCSTSPEPGQALASLRYEQGMPEEALMLLRKSMKLWFPEDEEEQEEDANGGGCRGDMMADDNGTECAQPSYEFRFECAKLLLELDDHTDTAIAVRGYRLPGDRWMDGDRSSGATFVRVGCKPV